MKKDLKNIGKIGEKYAKEYLISEHFEILEENFLVWGGEIDIIAFKNGKFHIIEVKTSQSYIKPEDHINKKKMLKVMNTAEYYLNYKQKRIKDKQDITFSLDIILINLNTGNNLKSIEYLPNFEL